MINPCARDADLTDPVLRDRAVAAARGDAPFDVLITGAQVGCLATHRLRRADVGIVGALIASVHAPSPRDAGHIVDATDCMVIPGLIDTHMHVESSMISPAAYSAHMLARGVTTVVWDPHEFANVAGLAGLEYALAEAAISPLRILPLVPSCVPAAPGYETAGADFDAEIIATALAQPGMVGLAEVMDMAAVIDRTPRMRAIVQAALASGKTLNGHARGLKGAALQAYAAAGITSDHELSDTDDLIARLEAGMWVELRGSHPYLLKGFAQALQQMAQFPSMVTLCTDDVFPDDLWRAGGLDAVVRTLIGHGLDPLKAIQAATLNAATRLGRGDLGLVAPGRRADLVIVEDLHHLRVRTVIRDGTPVTPPPPASHPAPLVQGPPKALQNTVLCRAPSTADILPKAPNGATRVWVATIDRPRFTRWGEATAEVRDGRVLPPDGATIISVIHRHGRTDDTPRTGFLTGWGVWRGAFGTTVSHDSHNLTLFGADPADMAVAARALINAGGGMVAVLNGQVTALLALPIGGLVSDAPLARVADDFTALQTAMAQIVHWEPPYLTFKALVGATLACNPGPHQTDLGIADPMQGILMPTPVLRPA